MKIAITAESTIDLTKEMLDKYDINVLPYSVILGDNEFKDGEISSKDIFEFVDKNKILPKTSAINASQYEEFFREVLNKYDAVIHFCLSSGISSACSHAIEAADNFDNVYIVDTKSLSTGIALLAINARKLTYDEKLTPKEIYEKILDRVDHVQASFIVKKLEYLYKGGRCSALAYFGANLLMIRPQIILKEGKMDVHKKYLGKMEKVISNYCKDTLNEFNTPDKSIAFITYTTATDGMIENARRALESVGFNEIYETHAGATITSHCGENTLGILYLNDGE